ncbi:MAG: hypothetical protein LBT10_03475 [Methanobrevibacter sp.]|jgi:hypothetical protein|nr:hypothetical protein [Methanobrevibacter sp.]
MDRIVKIILGIIFILFVGLVIIGFINGGVEEIKGTMTITKLKIDENSLDFPDSINVACHITAIKKLDYLRLMTVYKDEDGNILYENPNAWTKEDILANAEFDVSEFPGYKLNKNKKADIVELFFFTTRYNSNLAYSNSVSYTSIYINHGTAM